MCSSCCKYIVLNSYDFFTETAMERECEAFPWEFSESPGILSQENMNLWNIVAAKTAKFNARYFRRRD